MNFIVKLMNSFEIASYLEKNLFCTSLHTLSRPIPGTGEECSH